MGNEIKLLETLLAARSNKREKRSLELLRKPNDGSPKTWAVFLPPAFNAALDIAQTQRVVELQGEKSTVLEWTQGSSFSFSAGDVIYDVEEAYLEWRKAIKKIGFCLEVDRAASASPQQRNQPRFPGSLVLRVGKPNSDYTRMEALGQVAMSQDDFVRFAISGENDKLRRVLGHIV